MMNWHALEVEAEYRQRDFLNKAEVERLLRPMEKRESRETSVICLALDNLGKLLIGLGSGLRTRYGTLA